MSTRGIANRVRRAWGAADAALGPSTKLIVPLAVVSVVGGVAEAGILALIAQIAFTMSGGGSSTDVGLGPLAIDASVPQLLGLALGLAVVRVVAQWLIAWITARMYARAQSRMRTALFSSYASASWAEQSRDRGGHLQEMMTSHIKSAAQAAMIVAGAVAPLTTFLILAGSAFLLSPAMAVVVAVAAVGIFLILRPFGRMTRRQGHLHSVASLSLAEGVGEAVHLTEEMHVYGTGPQHRAQVDRLIGDVERPFFRTQLLSIGVPAFHQGLALLLVIMGLAGLYAVGADDLGQLGAIVLLLVRSLSYAQVLQSSYQKLNDSSPFLSRLLEEVERYESHPATSGSRPVDTIGQLRFEGVSFSYAPGRPVLDDLSFEIESGEAIGVVGSSGSGKSTLVQLLLRLRDPDEGRYLLNGIDVRELSLSDWQQRVAFVSQEPRLLSGTAAENIRYHRDLDQADVERAARLAHIHDDILTWHGGYEHRVGHRLDAVSGGQRQRLCLARALAGRPEMIVLDEPTSALDPRSEAAIQRSLDELHGSVTLVIVAHRMSTLTSCDRIMVVEGGRLEAFGPADDLRRSNRYFHTASQLSVAGTVEWAG